MDGINLSNQQLSDEPVRPVTAASEPGSSGCLQVKCFTEKTPELRTQVGLNSNLPANRVAEAAGVGGALSAALVTRMAAAKPSLHNSPR